MRVLARFKAKELEGKVVSDIVIVFPQIIICCSHISVCSFQFCMFYGVIYHWWKPFRESLPPLYQAMDSALQVCLL